MSTHDSETPKENQPDKDALNEPLLREHDEPSEQFLPMPLFMVLIISLLCLWAGVYFERYSGNLDPMVYDETAKAGDKSAQVAAPFDPMKAGKSFFSKNCAVCHQATGAGIPSVYPPLAGSDWVKGSEERLVRILLFGMQGTVTVNGTEFNGVMPAFGTSKDRDLAAVLTFIRTNEWGNNAEPVSEETVAAVREKYKGQTTPNDGPTLQTEYQ
jgi:mono/diheme cytochrome c family protein